MNLLKKIFPHQPSRGLRALFLLILILLILYPFVELNQIKAIAGLESSKDSILTLAKWVLLTSTISLSLTVFINSYSGCVGSEICSTLIKQSIRNPVLINIENRNKLIDIIAVKITRYSEQYITSILRIIQSGIASLAILAYAIINVKGDLNIAIVLFIAICYVIFILSIRKNISSSEIKANNSSKNVLNKIDEIYTSPIRFSVRRKENYQLTKEIVNEDRYMRSTHAWMRSIQNSPRPIIEILGSFSLLILSISTLNNGESLLFGRELLLLAGTVYRLIPTFQMFYGNYMSYKSFKSSFLDIYHYIKYNKDEICKFDVKSSIYPTKEKYKSLSTKITKFHIHNINSLSNIELKISAGDWVLINGQSGCGKSTIMKILIGVLDGYDGYVRIENHEGIQSTAYSSLDWWDNIDYLSNEDERDVELNPTKYITKKNLLDLSEKDYLKLLDIMKVSELNSVLKIDRNYTNLSSRKVFKKFTPSKGQKQRLKIARSLWIGKEWLFWDEAVSGLDKKTERNLLSKIKEYHKGTLVLISHSDIDKMLFDTILEL